MSTSGPDGRVWPMGAIPFHDSPRFQDTRNAGWIQIQH
jgi:hypothetical protein